MSPQPQQPELRRSGKGASVQGSAETANDASADNREFDHDHHPTPPGNKPGWAAPTERPATHED